MKYKNSLCIIFISILLLGCHNLPNFGIMISEKSDTPVWFSQLPEQYVIKHLATLSVNGKTHQIDFIGYMLVKDKNFRLVAMNELGMTIFDVIAKKGQKPKFIKKFKKFHHPVLVNRLIDYIRLTFLSKNIGQNRSLSLYKSKKKTHVYVMEKDFTWCAWEQGIKPLRIFGGKNRAIEYMIEYDYSESSIMGFPKKITISYTQYKMILQLKILSIKKKIVPEKTFKG